MTEERIPELVARAALPAVVKPIASGSSVGVYIVNTRAELENALAESVKLGAHRDRGVYLWPGAVCGRAGGPGPALH